MTRPSTYQTVQFSLATSIASQTDWNGNKTVFTNDVHGQPTTTVEASGTSNSRTTSVIYDQIWVHLPAAMTAPGMTTSFTYDGNGDPLSRTQTDTTTTTTTTTPYATSGQVRTWKFT